MKTVIIVAGGKGERMHTQIPKQFLEIKGKPVLMYTIESFYNYDSSMQLIIVLPKEQVGYWQELCRIHHFSVSHQVVEGGKTRFHSVKNGLAAVVLPSLVAVHDGVRPLVSNDTISRCFDRANFHKAVVPVVDLVDSIREVSSTGPSFARDRSRYKLVQTPQVFDGELLFKAYEQEFSEFFTDDASVVESFGADIYLVEGNRENIKITTAFDLKLASCLLSDG